MDIQCRGGALLARHRLAHLGGALLAHHRLANLGTWRGGVFPARHLGLDDVWKPIPLKRRSTLRRRRRLPSLKSLIEV